jgi:hypothetical protein
MTILLQITIIATVASLGYTLFRDLRPLPPFPPNTFDPPVWKGKIQTMTSKSCATFLRRTNHQALGLTPGEFVLVLEEIECQIKAEPAVSTYWDIRNELEEALKQERLG